MLDGSCLIKELFDNSRKCFHEVCVVSFLGYTVSVIKNDKAILYSDPELFRRFCDEFKGIFATCSQDYKMAVIGGKTAR